MKFAKFFVLWLWLVVARKQMNWINDDEMPPIAFTEDEDDELLAVRGKGRRGKGRRGKGKLKDDDEDDELLAGRRRQGKAKICMAEVEATFVQQTKAFCRMAAEAKCTGHDAKKTDRTRVLLAQAKKYCRFQPSGGGPLIPGLFR